MRITNSMMVNQFLTDANASLNRLSKCQEEVDSTKRVSSISDDPQATLTALKARHKLSELDTYQSNIETVTSSMTEAESAADEMNEILQTVYEQVVSATSGTKTQDDLNTIADELTSLQDELVSIGNTTVGTNYIFGGYNLTGTTDGVNTTAPFSVDETTGHLIYNGIDLTQLSCAEDYETNTTLMSSYSSTITSDATEISGTSSDDYARDTICADALDALESLVSAGETALQAAEEFGIDTSSTEYTDLSSFVSSLSDLSDALSDECSKDLAGDYILESDCTELNADGTVNYDYYEENGLTVMTQEEYDNCFNISDAQGILDEITELLGNTDITPGVGLDYSMTEATDALQASIEAELTASGAETALADEEDNQATLQIGTTKTAAYTFPGTDLFGTGTENVYYILDKCISMLQSGDTDGLSGMISEIQDAQSNVLSFESEIGTMENTMSLISSRYDASTTNYTEMQSEAVDADMAEAITEYTTAQTVYSAALAAGAEIVQTSLIDFLT